MVATLSRSLQLRACTRVNRSLPVLLLAAALLPFPSLVAQTSPAESTQPASTPATQTTQLPVLDAESLKEQKRQEAIRELRQQEHQRILGFLPNFNSTSVTSAAALSPQQKISLAFKTATDPITFVVAVVDGGIGQAQNSFDGYGQGAQGFGKRVGAAYLDSFDGTMIGNAFLPILFRQDPRYFRKGTGSFRSRLLYSISTTVRAKSDSGHWQPNYSNLLGNIAAGGIANVYYPASDRGIGLTFQRALTVSAEGSIGALLVEFWPDISRHLFKRTYLRHQEELRQDQLNQPAIKP